MTDAHEQIRNLIHRYSEGIDTGKFEIWDELFEHASLWVQLGDNEPVPLEIAHPSSLAEAIIIYADGTPRTRHLVTNSIIEVDEDAGTATARSYNTTLQQVPEHPVEIIATARYNDVFERVEGWWRFTRRTIRHATIDGVNRDFIGDMSRHSRSSQAPARGSD